jgi:hypothetical protein
VLTRDGKVYAEEAQLAIEHAVLAEEKVRATKSLSVKGGVKGSHCGGVKVVQWKVRNCGENGVWSVAEDGILPAVRSAGGC